MYRAQDSSVLTTLIINPIWRLTLYSHVSGRQGEFRVWWISWEVLLLHMSIDKFDAISIYRARVLLTDWLSSLTYGVGSRHQYLPPILRFSETYPRSSVNFHWSIHYICPVFRSLNKTGCHDVAKIGWQWWWTQPIQDKPYF